MLPSYPLSLITERLARRSAGSAASGPRAEREAAVAVVLRPPVEPSADAELLLIRRAEHPDDPWSGHMAFPGGRRDPDDANLEVTAIRETLEEVGLDLATHARRIARLEDVPAVARGVRLGLTIAPFVFVLGDAARALPLTPNDEVAEALWVPIGPLARGEGAGVYPYVLEGRQLELPCLRVGERVVWGLTYRMLQALFAELASTAAE